MSRLTSLDCIAPDALNDLLETLPHWSLSKCGLRIERTLLFTDFVQAFAFMTQVAAIAESRDHHPEWCNVWNRVNIALTTHSAGGVTRADLELASAIEGVIAQDGSCGGCR